ncbi:MAG: DUF5011 domain-containing protein [Chitinophagaceae bacterium]|nr:DUF5011 domain-containing protein [Chitinophagaceae bacterium]
MKKTYALIFAGILTMIMSCSKDPIISTNDQVGISKITYYPTITVTGNSIVAVANGSVFTDPGVKASAGSADVPVVTTPTLNTNTDGVYTLTYTATNKDGFSSTATRTVVVYTTAADAAAHDLSGSYLRAATGVSAIWTKIALGVYVVQNPGGAVSGTSLTVVAINPSGYTISIPSQRASDGNVSQSTSESYINLSPAIYKWIFLNPTYGTGLRTFVKQ